MDTATFTKRRQILRQAMPDGIILLPANQHAPRNYPEAAYPWRQDSHLLYYTGIDQPGPILAIFPDGEEILYCATATPEEEVWTGPQPKPGQLAAGAGISCHATPDKLPGRLSGQTVHYLPPYRAERILELAGLLNLQVAEVKSRASLSLARAVADQRNIKEEREIEEIEKALAVTARSYKEAMRITAPGLLESEVTAAMQACALAASRQQSFQPIVSVQGQILHCQDYGNTLQEGDLLVLDSGPESPLRYASDITRTIPVSGRFTPRQLPIYETVLAAQLGAIEKARPGVNNRELHLTAADIICNGLQAAGLMRGNCQDAVAAGAHALFFPHGLGHLLGLDVHDMEDLGDAAGYPPGSERSSQFGLAALRLARDLQPGFVITVEPGIYFIPALIDIWATAGKHKEFINYEAIMAYKDFGGIRIEDDILITEKGSRVLGPPIPKTPREIESSMQQTQGD